MVLLVDFAHEQVYDAYLGPFEPSRRAPASAEDPAQTCIDEHALIKISRLFLRALCT